ncbi:hypothetical protein ACFPN7_19010 [Amycolatopsis halotolerans]|uniref:hypothetical protein n=1 Tax=Amycolatopsis halotolerans TaxID=330083 RepID=UPI00360F3B61
MFPQLNWLGPVERTSPWAREPRAGAGLSSVKDSLRESDSLKEPFTDFKTRSHGGKSGVPVLLASFVDG